MKTWERRLESGYQRAVSDMVSREVCYCVSGLISELAGKEEYFEELWPVLSTPELYCPDCNAEHDDIIEADPETLEDDDCPICDNAQVSANNREAFEHWIVTGWLMRELEERGEMVVEDFLGLTLWGRSCTGQTIAMDNVIQDIYDDLHDLGKDDE